MRIFAAALAIGLLIWHAWSALQGLSMGLWLLSISSGAIEPMIHNPGDEVYMYGSSVAMPLFLLSAATGLFSALGCAIAAGLIMAGRRRRFVAATMIAVVLADAVGVLPDLVLAVYSWDHLDYMFTMSSQWLASMGGDWLELGRMARFPLEVLGLFASFVGCTVAAIAVSVWGRTARGDDASTV